LCNQQEEISILMKEKGGGSLLPTPFEVIRPLHLMQGFLYKAPTQRQGKACGDEDSKRYNQADEVVVTACDREHLRS